MSITTKGLVLNQMVCNKTDGVDMVPTVFWGPHGPWAACSSTNTTALNQMGD